MLGQPVSMLIPRVVGFKLSGSIPAGATATDVVLTITEMLRQHGVVGKFVEFYGEGVASVPLANRATIGNMSPEFGSTAAIFPIDDVTLDYLRLTGRSDEQVALVEAYAREQGLWHDPSTEAEVLRVPRARPVHRRPEHRRSQAPAGPHRPDPRPRRRSAVRWSTTSSTRARRTKRCRRASPPATSRSTSGGNGNGAPHAPGSGRAGPSLQEGRHHDGGRHARPRSTTAPSRSPRSPAAPTPPTPR